MTRLIKITEFRGLCGEYHSDEACGHYSRDDKKGVVAATEAFEAWQREVPRDIVSVTIQYVHHYHTPVSSWLDTGPQPPDYVITVTHRE